jgi:hypothetical protein
VAIPCWRQSPPLLTFEAPTAAVILPKSQAMDRLLNVQGQQVAGNPMPLVFPEGTRFSERGQFIAGLFRDYPL